MLDDPEAVARAACDLVRACARGAVAARGLFTIALSGGSTPRRLYRLLAGLPDDPGARGRGLPWSRTEIFFGDERCVPPEHQDSNFRMASEALFSSAAIDPGRVHPVRFESYDRAGAARAAESYESELARVFDVRPGGAPPRFDLVLLGLGPDGHTASLFSGTDALGESVRWVAAPWVEKLAAPRVTFTYPLLNAARGIVFLVAGPDKATVVQQILGPDSTPGRHPAQGVRPEAGEMAWLLDRAAAAGLRQRP